MSTNPSVTNQKAAKFVKIGEASQLLGVSIDTLRRWEKAGKIETVRTPGGTRLYKVKSLAKIQTKQSLSAIKSVTKSMRKIQKPVPFVTAPIVSATTIEIPIISAADDVMHQEEAPVKNNSFFAQILEDAKHTTIADQTGGNEKPADLSQNAVTSLSKDVRDYLGKYEDHTISVPVRISDSNQISNSSEDDKHSEIYASLGSKDQKVHSFESQIPVKMEHAEQSSNSNYLVNDVRVSALTRAGLINAEKPVSQSNIFNSSRFTHLVPNRKNKTFIGIVSVLLLFIFALPLFALNFNSNGTSFLSFYTTSNKKVTDTSSQVLAESTIAQLNKYLEINADISINGTLAVEGEGIFIGNVTAPNIVYSLVAGQNITISGDPQNPTISTIGGLTTETDTLASVTARGASTSTPLQLLGGITGNLNLTDSLVLGRLASDPGSPTNGATYYNTGSNKFRCYINGSWQDCDTDTDTDTTNPGFSGITLAGSSGTSQTLVDGDTLTIAASNGLTSTAGNTDKVTIALVLPASGTSTTTSSNSGLELSSSGLSLLRGCSGINNILKWNNTTAVWECAADAGGSGGVVNIKSNETTTYTGVATIDFDSSFSLANTPSTEVNVSIATGGITGAHILDGTITNADIGAGAAIAYSKMNLTSSILTGDITDNTITATDLSPTLTFVDSDILNLSAINNSTTTEGLILPQNTICTAGTAEGQICWDTDNDQLIIGNGATTTTISGSGVSSLNSLTGGLTIAGGGINSVSAGGATITITGTEADTLATVTGRGATTSTALTFAANGAASAPAALLSGTWFSGGTATTTKPQLLIESSSATLSNAWSTAGTGIGLNSAATFTGNLVDAQLNASSRFSVNYQGNLVAAGTGAFTGSLSASNFSGSHSGTSSGINTGDQTITLTGDVTGSGTGSFATTIAADAVTLGTDTTGNYAATITGGSGISSTGATTGENISHTLSLGALTADWNQTGAFDISLNNASSELKILESVGAAFYGIFDVTDLTADRTYTFPDATGTVCLSTGNCAGSGSSVTQSGTNALNQIAYFTSTNNITSSANFLIDPSATTGNTFALTNTALTTGKLLNLTGTSTANTNTALTQNLFSITNAQSTLANTSGIIGLGINFTNNPTIAGNTEYAFQIQNQVTSNTTDNVVAALLRLDNADTNVGGTNGSTIVTDAILITDSGGIGYTNLLNTPTIDISSAGNITGAGTISSGAITSTGASSIGSLTLTTALTVGNGGTGATTLTSNGVLFGNGTSAIGTTAAGTNGQLLLGVTAGAPAFATMSGDATITNAGVLAIAADAVALGTDTTGNYVQSVTNGSGISGGNGGSEGAALTLALGALTADWNQTGAFDISLNNANSELKILESVGAAFYGIFDVTDLGADRTYTFPNASGTVAVSASTPIVLNATTGDISCATCLTSSSGGTFALTLAGTLGTNQTISSGDTITIAAGSGITTTGGATDTVTIASTLGTSISASEVDADSLDFSEFKDALTLDANSTTISYITTAATDPLLGLSLTANGATDVTENVFKISNALTASTTDTTVNSLILLDNADSAASGTTVVTDAIKITNSGGAGFTNFLETPSIDISSAGNITGAGTISSGAITSTGASSMGSLTLTTALTVGNGGTGTTTLTSNGVLFGNGTSAIGATAAGTNGQLLLGVTAGAPAFATMSGDATITNTGALAIAADAVALGTDTTGNYVSTITGGSGISSTGATTGENIAHTLSLGALTADWNQTGAFDISLNNASSELKILESVGAAFYGIFDVTDLGADRTYTFPNASGTVAVSASTPIVLNATTGDISCPTCAVAGGAGGSLFTDGGATTYLTSTTDNLAIGGTDNTSEFFVDVVNGGNIIVNSSAVGSNAAIFNFTQADDLDATDTTSGLTLSGTSSSGDADLFYGINISNITAGAATETAIRLGSGYDRLFEFEKGANDLYITAAAPSGGSFTLNIPAITANRDICTTEGNCAGAGSGVTQSGTNANTQIAYFTAGSNITSASNFTINPTLTTGTLLGLSSTATLTGSLTGQSIDLSGTTATGQSSTALSLVANPIVTNTGAGTYAYKGLTITGSAITQNTGAGTDTFTGIDITTPAITQTTGSITSTAAKLTLGAGTTAGTINGVNIVPPATTGAGTTTNAINIGAITTSTGTDTALLIGANWDTILDSATLDISGTGNITGAGTISAGAITSTGASSFGSITLTTDLAVTEGGTGASTLTSNGVLFGNGTSAIGATAAGTNGQLLLGVTAGAPAFATMSGDATITNTGALAIAADAVALGTDTTGNYVATITAGTGISSTGATTGENISHTLTVDQTFSPTWTGNHTYTPGTTSDLTINTDADSTLALVFSSGTTATSAFTQSITNSASSGTVSTIGQNLSLAGTANAAGANTITGINFANVTTATNNTFNGLTFGTGFNNFLTSPTINISAAGAITGATGLTSSGSISLTPGSTNDINFTLNSAGGSDFTVTGLAAGTGSALCVDTAASNKLVTCTVGSGGLSGSGTAGQIAFFNGPSSVTSETLGFGWDSTNKLLTLTGLSTATTSTTEAITSASNTLTSGGLLSAALTSGSATASFTGDIGSLSSTRTNSTAAQTLTDTGNLLDLSRTTITNNGTATTNVTGAILNISDTSTQTLGTLSNSANLAALTQNYSGATGAVLAISNAGTGAGISLAGAGTRSINSTSGNLTISTTTSGILALTSAGALNLTGTAASTWDIGNNTLSLQTTGNGAITTGSGLVTTGGALTVTGTTTLNGNTQIGNAVGDTLTVYPTTLSFFAENPHTIQIGDSTTANTAGGALTVKGAAGLGTGAGGALLVTGGAGGATGTGGAINLTTGAGGSTSGGSGNLSLDTGSVTSGTKGTVSIGTTNASALSLGNASGTFALASSGGLNVTTAGALTGVASINTINVSSTALTFTSTAPTISVSTAATAIALDAGTSGAVNIAGTSTGDINIGGGSGSTGCTLTNNSGAFACTGAITGSNISGSNTGDQTITLTGDVTGSGTGSFATTIAANSVALTTDTTGDYVGTITGSGTITSTGATTGEGIAHTLSITADSVGDTQLAFNTGQHLTTTSNVTFANLTTTGNTQIGDAVADTLTIYPTTLSFIAENAHTIKIGDSTTAGVVGGALSVSGAAGAANIGATTSGAGGAITLAAGTGGASSGATGTAGAGGSLSFDAGAAGAANGGTAGANGSITIGGTNASALTLGRTGITTTNAGALTVTQALTASSTLGVTGVTTLSGNLLANGNTTIGDATTDRLTITSQILGASPLVFQGATDDAITTTLAFTDTTTSNKTITFPNASGTVAVSATGPITLSALGDIGCATCLTSANGVTSVTGTANQITASPTTGAVVLTLPSAITTPGSLTTTTSLTATTDFTVNGNTTIGNATSDTLSIFPTTLSFSLESPHTIQIADSATANTAGGALTLKSAAGLGTGAGGALSLAGGAGGATGVGGAISITTGAGGSTSGGSGNLSLDSGSVTSGTKGTVSLGTTNASVLSLGNASGTFALTSSGGLNVTTGGALTGVASINTIATSATALTFAGAGSVAAGGTSALALDAGTTGAVNIAGTSTGDINIGGGSASTGCTLTNSSGAFACTGAITGSNISGSNTGDQTITLTGDVTGSGTGSFATTIAANSVALTTDTTGDYVGTITGSGTITSTGTTTGEGIAHTLSITADSVGDTQLAFNTGQHLTTTSNVTFANLTTTGNTQIGDAVTDTLTVYPTTLSFFAENAHTIKIGDSTTAGVAGGALTIGGTAGAANVGATVSGAGGAITLAAGTGGASSGVTGTAGAGGSLSFDAGAAGSIAGGGTAGANGSITIGGTNASALTLGRTGVTTTNAGALTVTQGLTAASTVTFTGIGTGTVNNSVCQTAAGLLVTCGTGSTGTGDITAVGSMTSGDAFADATADDDWLGLGATAGRIGFDDLATDEVDILTATLDLNANIITNIGNAGTDFNATGGLTLADDLTVTGNDLTFGNAETISNGTNGQLKLNGFAPTASAIVANVLIGANAIAGGNASGTYLGINAATGYAGDFLNFETNSVEVARILSDGTYRIGTGDGNNTTSLGTNYLRGSFNLTISTANGGSILLDAGDGGSTEMTITSGGLITHNFTATSGSLEVLAATGATTQAGAYIGSSIDLSTNITNATNNQTGMSITLKDGSTSGTAIGIALAGTYDTGISFGGTPGTNLIDSSTIDITAAGGLTGVTSYSQASGSISSTGLTGLTQTLASGTAAITAPTLNLNTTSTGATAIGNATGTFALTSSGGLNVTTAGALTGVASINTINVSSTALTFTSTAPTISVSTAATALALDAGTTGAVNIAGTSTGDINIGGGSGTTGCTVTNSTGALACTAGGTFSALTVGGVADPYVDETGDTMSGTLAFSGVTGSAITLGTIASAQTGITGTLANTTAANATGISLTSGTITTSGTQSLYSGTITAIGAGTTNGLLLTPPATTTAGGTINGINIGNITTSNGTDTAINIGTGWDSSITAAGLAGANAILYAAPTTGIFTTATTTTASQCLVSQAGASGVPVWAACAGASVATLQQAYDADAGTDDAIILMDATGSIRLQNIAGTKFGVEMATTTAPTVDMMTISNAGASQAAATNGVDGLFIDFRAADNVNFTNSGLNIALTSAGTTTGAAGDVLNGINLAVSGTSGQEQGLNFADNNFDLDINALTDLNLGIGSTSALRIASTGITSIGNVAHTIVDSSGALTIDSSSTGAINIGTSANAKTLTLGNASVASIFAYNTGATTQDAATIGATSITSGSALTITGNASTGITSGANDGFVNVTADVGAGGTAGNLVYFSPDFTAAAATIGRGLYVNATDTVAVANTDYGIHSLLTVSNAPTAGTKSSYGIFGEVANSSTNSDSSVGIYGKNTVSGGLAEASAVRLSYGAIGDIDYTGANTGAGSFTLAYGGIFTAHSTGNHTNGVTIMDGMQAIAGVSGTATMVGSTILANAVVAGGDNEVVQLHTGGTLAYKGVFVENPSMNTTGTTSKYGVYIEDVLTNPADTNYALYSEGGQSYFGGNVGLGLASPTAQLDVLTPAATTGINLAGTAPASVATNGTSAATNTLLVVGTAGGASSGITGQTGGTGGALSLTAGVGGAVVGASGIGGVGGSVSLTSGAGGNGAATGGVGGSLSITAGAAGTGGAANGGTLTLNSGAVTGAGTSTLNLGSANATTVNLATATSATTLNIGAASTTAVTVAIAGGSGDTGCTVAGATGNLTCTGNIAGSSSGTVGFWSRTSTTLSPATTNDIVSLATTNTTGADLALTNTGVYTGTGIFNLTANSATTGTAAAISTTGMTTGEAFDITGTWAPSDGTDNEALDVNLTFTPTTLAATFRGLDLTLTEGVNALANTDYGIKLAVNNSANTSTGTHSIYGGYFAATGKTAGTTTAYGVYGSASGADTNYALYADGRVGFDDISGTNIGEIFYNSNGVGSGQFVINAGGTNGVLAEFRDCCNGVFSVGATNVQSSFGYGLEVNETTLTTANIEGLDVNFTMPDGVTAGDDQFGQRIDLTQNDVDGDLHGLYIANLATAALVGVDDVECLVCVDNVENTAGVVTDGLRIRSSGIAAGITNDISLQNSETITNSTDGTITLGVTGTSALNVGSTGISSIGNVAHTIVNSAGALAIDSATTGAINIGTGANAKTITVGNATGATALAFTSGTGSQTHTSSVATTSTTSSAFVFTANALTTGTGLYTSSTSLTTGKLAELSVPANTMTTGSLLNLTTTSTGLTSATLGGSLLNLDWSPAIATTASGDLFRLTIGANGTTTGNLFNIVDTTSSIFSVKETAFETSLPSNFTAPGDVAIAYDINFTNPTASYIKSAAPLYLVSGETFNSSDLTLQTYNQGSIVLDTANTTSTAINWTNSTLTTGIGMNLSTSAQTTGTLLALTSTGTITTGGEVISLAANSATTGNLIDVTGNGLTTGRALNISSSTTGLTSAGALQEITLSGSNAANAGPLLLLTNSGTSNTNTTFTIQHNATGTNNLALRVNDIASDTTPFIIDGTGQVGIGVTAATQTLHVAGTMRLTTSVVVTDDRTLCTIAASGEIEIKNGACGTSSMQYKENVKNLDYGLDELMELNPVSFNYIKDSSAPADNSLVDNRTKRRIGFIAEEMQNVIPEVVIWENGVIDGIDYSYLTSLNTKALQQLNQKVENALLTINADGSAPTEVHATKLVLDGNAVIAGTVTASSYSLDATAFTRNGVFSNLLINGGKSSVVDAINLLAQAQNSTTDKVLGLEAENASQSAALDQAQALGQQAVDHALSLDEKVASTSSTIDSLSAKIDELLAGYGEATDSGQNQTNSQVIADGLVSPNVMIATDSAELNTILIHSEATVSGTLQAYDGIFQNSLKSLGETFLGKTTIAGDIAINGTLTISEGNKIDAIGTLFFQTNPLASAVDFFNGLISFDKAGKVIAPIIVADQFIVKADKSAGVAIIPAGQTEIPVFNYLTEANSIITITPETVTTTPLAVTEKVAGSGFVVTIATPSLTDIQFNYLIIGREQ